VISFTNRAATTAMAVALTVTVTTTMTHANDHARMIPPATPGSIAVPAGNRAFLIAHALGTQNYMCLPGPSGIVWAPIGPQAALFNDDGGQVITHFLSLNPEESGVARATWQHSRDTSAVWAIARRDSVAAAAGRGPGRRND
jgi:hypothetical protein